MAVACSDAGDSLNDCRIIFLSEIYKIEEAGSLGDIPAGSDSPLKSMLRVFFFSEIWNINIWYHTFTMLKFQ